MLLLNVLADETAQEAVIFMNPESGKFNVFVRKP